MLSWMEEAGGYRRGAYMIMNPQDAEELWVDPGGNLAEIWINHPFSK